MINCPRCNGPMALIRTKNNNTVLDRCQSCLGIWFDSGEILTFLSDQQNDDFIDQVKNVSKNSSNIKCPHCNINLMKKIILNNSIEIDNCSSCDGIFLDKGELHQIIKNQTVKIKKSPLKTKYKSLDDYKLKKNLPHHFKQILDNDEQVIWAEKPHFFAIIFSKLVVNSIFIILTVLYVIIGDKEASSTNLLELVTTNYRLILIFFSLYIAYIYLTIMNIAYVLTSKRVIISSGIFGIDFSSIDYVKVTDLSLNVGPIDKIIGTGNIFFHTASGNSLETTKNANSFRAIVDPYSVYKKVKKLTYRK